MFRGREQSHPERGRDLLMRLAEDVKEIGQIESPPLLDGRNMVMVLGPTKNAGVKKRCRKQKTHSAAKKRFKVTGTGKLLRRKAPKSHYLEHKSAKRKRGFRQGPAGRPADVPDVKRLLGKEVADATRQAIRPRAQEAPQGPGAGQGLLGPQALELHATPRSRSSTRSPTPTATARTRSARSGGSGSCGSTRPRAVTGSPTTSSSPGCRRPRFQLDRKVLADLAVSDPQPSPRSPSRRRPRSTVLRRRLRRRLQAGRALPVGPSAMTGRSVVLEAER